MIKTDQGKMIASLLNRPYKKIVLNRFMIQEEEKEELIKEPNAVKAGLEEHYKNQFRKRKTKLDKMSEEWKKIYEPRNWINNSWYNEVEKKINEKE
jgi:hypothetical protein